MYLGDYEYFRDVYKDSIMEIALNSAPGPFTGA